MVTDPSSHHVPVHSLNPVVFEVGGFGVHWYGLSYVLGFAAAILLLRYLTRRGNFLLPQDKVIDFITFGAIFGVLVGGRLGYMLFYNTSEFFSNPLLFFKIWDGGMASHGGIIGLMLYTLWFSRRHKIAWTHIGDHLVVAAPLGIFFGRIANFINGELYGRAATGIAWAMKFPGELKNPSTMLPGNYEKARMAAESVAPEIHYNVPNDVLISEMRTNEALRDAVGAFLTSRHPSQLYQAALEGLALFLILFSIRMGFRNLPNGLLTGCFFIFYAVFRMIGEVFREPDSALIIGITKGQFYSSFMILIGLAFLIYAVKWGRRSQPGQA